MLTLRLQGGPMARPLISRAIGAAAARGDLPVDRLGDASIVADLLAHAIDGVPAEVEISEGDGWVEVHTGPLIAGRVEALAESRAIPDAEPILEQLTSGYEFSERGEDAWIRVRFER